MAKDTPKSPKAKAKTKTSPSIFDSHNGLGTYLTTPESHPSVISHNTKFVSIHDKYPKSTVHTLLLPRDPSKNLLHPFEAFEDPVFLAEVREETEVLKEFVISELQRLYGREETVGRDWGSGILVGVHARPSMNHLHVHVLSPDMISESMKSRKHYNSFNMPFLVPLEDFPLARDDPRRNMGKSVNFKRELVCWRCGLKFNFVSGMGKLKVHLREEFEDWKKGSPGSRAGAMTVIDI